MNLQAKTALDMEIAVYRKLVECEEDRLGITASKNVSQCVSVIVSLHT